MKPTRAHWITAAIAIAVLAGLALLLRPHAIRAELATVVAGPLAVTFEEEGRTRLRDRYVVAAPAAGYVRRIELEQGDTVTAGQVVAELEASPAVLLDPANRSRIEAEVAAAESAQRAARDRAVSARAGASLAKREFERLDAMKSGSAVSASALDAAREAMRRAEADRAAAESEAAAAAQRATATRSLIAREGERREDVTLPLRSPVAGVVIRRAQESAMPVAAGQALLEVGDPAAIEIEVEALSTDAVKLRPNGAARIVRWGGEPHDVRVKVILAIDSPREQWLTLGDGYRVEVEFTLAREAQVLQVPSGAVFRHQGRWAVFVEDGGRARLREVEIGPRAGLVTAIAKGLRAGERVVAFPDDQISDGARLSAVERSASR